MVCRALIALVVMSVPAAADVTQTLKSGAVVDWSRGVVTARGVGPADRHAPSPAVARDAARVHAEAAAREALVKAAHELPGVARDVDVAGAVERATVAALDLDTDGSATVELALPIEAVRVAASGPRKAEPGAEAAPRVVVIDARAFKIKPAVGIAVSEGGATWSGPMLFVDAAPADGDPRVGAHPVRVMATKAGAKAISIDGEPPAPGALVVVVIGGKS